MTTTLARAYACNDEERRAALSSHSTLMGIDFLEVSDDQQELYLHFVPAVAGVSKIMVPPDVTTNNITITGGVRITRIQVVDVDAPANRPGVLVVRVTDDGDATNGVGDFSLYTLRLVDVPNLDPLFAEVSFSFKAGCSTEFDCKTELICQPEPLPEPEIDYLAKDFSSFRWLMLNRMTEIIPGWTERNAADLQVALVELLAYVGDYLSYQQDAVATEAYLGTAKRRASVRRHARLVDYLMHDGSNARVWAQVRVNADNVKLPRGTQLLTRVGDQQVRLPEGSLELATALSVGPEVFETLYEATLFEAHNELRFYTWGNRECCLPKGATQATLRGSVASLHVGDYLILEEVRGSRTGEPEDADPAHRHAVRLTNVVTTTDPLGGRFLDPPTGAAVPVTEVEWALEDALPFPLCISAQGQHAYLEDISVARGNIVLADHGRTVPEEEIEPVPQVASMVRVRRNGGVGEEPAPVFARFRPRLREAPLTQAAPYVDTLPPTPNGRQERLLLPAAAAMRWTTRDPMPAISLFDGASDTRWLPRRDLLDSDPFASEFVVEVEADGRAYLRFGDDRFGMRPAPGTSFTATYRVGNGVRGNIGAEALGHIVSSDDGIVGVRNPMPAQGGVEPESIEHVRQSAPSAFRTPERAVTPEDYAGMVELHPQVQRAAATVRWTGSWRTIFVTVDRLGGLEVDAGFREEIRLYLDQFRMAGHDVELDNPRFVFLEVEMHVCVEPDYFRGDVRTVLLDLFSNRAFPDGRRGVFHPDNFTFGQPVYLSPLYAAAQAVEGVASVEITRLQRLGSESRKALEDGYLSVGRLEVARLDNDPNFLERGVFRLTVEGGK
jgi:hypothetical protein